MGTRRFAGWWVVMGWLALTACEEANEALPDALGDTSAGAEVAPDATSAPDGSPDIPMDSAPEILPDLPPDLPSDTPPDLPSDTPADLPPDLPPDVLSDAPPDLPPACAAASDCEGLPHDDCEGWWTCLSGACVFTCDQTCDDPPAFSDDCAEVPDFQCGFQATCEGGEIFAEWHVHHFCGPDDPIEDIIDYTCTHACPHGCATSDYMDWPPDGAALVADLCAPAPQCQQPTDCEGQPHDLCEGAWSCEAGACTWTCGPPDLCDLAGGTCRAACQDKEHEVLGAGCAGEGACCAPDADCLGLGAGGLEMDWEGLCCEDLSPVADCFPGGGGCTCPKCPCFVCLPCGDGHCGPFEDACRCPADCPATTTCLDTKQSECEGDPYGDTNPGTLSLTPTDAGLRVTHKGTKLNCCLTMEICAGVDPEAGVVRLVERPEDPDSLCFCECLFTLETTIPDLTPGAWHVVLTSDVEPDLYLEGSVTVE